MSMKLENDEMFFKWSPAYSVNIEAIDNQHRELVNILNHLFIAVSKREGNKVIAEILDALTHYTQTHFLLEERLMREAEYRDIDAHMKEHRKLLDQLEQLSKKHLLEEKPIYFEMLSFLKCWLKEHIQGVDTKYSAALVQSGFSVESWELEATEEFARMPDSGKLREIWKAA